ncbi:MAG: ribonuclease P protein component [Candidatus Taylorbacteria bacterium]|nr:ribonuclease P protein component [Candidatus Taylorbacteria bacterium]
MSSRFFTIKTVPETFKKGRKYAVVISKKVAKLAVTRNLLRRRIFSIFRASTPLTTPVVVIVKKGAETLSFVEIKKELQSLFLKIK